MHHDFLAFLFLDDRFSSGLELANLVVNSGVLYHSWAAVRDLYSEINQNEQQSLSVRYKVSQQPNSTTIAFFTWPACSKDYVIQGGGGEELVSSSTLKESFPLFEFLCTKTNPQFSINKAAIELFASIRDSLPSLKSQVPLCPENSFPFFFFFFWQKLLEQSLIFLNFQYNW